jgi:serine/threonine protein kinase
LIGRKLLDKYEIIRVIGQGGMGSVYEAREIATNRRVAIKWMQARPCAPDDPDLLRFTQEARIAGHLDSPHVTNVIELARDPETDVPFQVMELLEGEDVRKLIERVGPLSPEVALRIAAQACAGLAAAHAAGVVHRDIKPDNIFLARDGRDVTVKLLDFGVAKIRPTEGGAAGGFTAPAVPMTKSGQMVGTPLFMAPEQIRGSKNVDARADVYSMGVTLYAMLAGAAPHAGTKSFAELLHSLVSGPTLPIRNAAPWVSPEVAAVVDRAREKDLASRFANAAELHAALSPLLRDGTALREENLTRMAEAERRIVPVHGNTDPNAITAVVHLDESVRAPAKQSMAAGSSGRTKTLLGAALVVLVAVVGAVLLLAGR